MFKVIQGGRSDDGGGMRRRIEHARLQMSISFGQELDVVAFTAGYAAGAKMMVDDTLRQMQRNNGGEV